MAVLAEVVGGRGLASRILEAFLERFERAGGDGVGGVLGDFARDVVEICNGTGGGNALNVGVGRPAGVVLESETQKNVFGIGGRCGKRSWAGIGDFAERERG